MINDIILGLSRTEEAFIEQVRDAFGRSIDETVFQPSLNVLQQLERTHRKAELREMEIHALTLELRMIL